MDWQPISTAPQDGTEIDVWRTASEYSDAERVTNASWGPCESDPYASSEEGRGCAVTWRRYGEMYGDGFWERLDEDGSVVTHWMPIPNAPETAP